MSSIVLSGITTITTFSMFNGWDHIADVMDDVRKIGCWIHSSLPDNKFIRATIYTLSTVAFVRSLPFILRRTSFFQYHEMEMLYFHRSNNNKDVIQMKEELLKELTEEKSSTELPLMDNEKLVILEVNIGSGTNASYFPEGAFVIGTDFLEEEKEKLENNFIFDGEGGKVVLNRFIHTRPEELAGVPDKSVSCVISFHSLCSARKKDRALAEILRVLMPGGRLYFIEHTTEKERFSLMWFVQINFRPSMFLVSCCIDCPEYYIENAGFSKVSYKTQNIDTTKFRGPLNSLMPHIYGYAIK